MGELIHAPAVLSHEDALAILDDFREGFATGDSLEGHITITMHFDMDEPPDSPLAYDVVARYRVGNTMGQGGMRMVGEFIPKEDE